MPRAPLTALFLPTLLALPALPTAVPVEEPVFPNGVFVGDDGVSPARVVVEDPCGDVVWLHVTLYRPAGRETHSVPYGSTMTPDVCWAPLRCEGCVPLVVPFAWVLENAEAGSYLAGGGSVVYDRYSYHEGAWALQGPFLGGRIEFHGADPAWP